MLLAGASQKAWFLLVTVRAPKPAAPAPSYKVSHER
jgi:hypothetical protein